MPTSFDLVRQQSTEAQTEGLRRRMVGVLREEQASVRTRLERTTLSHDELRAIVTAHNEKLGDLMREFLTRSARWGWRETVGSAAFPEYLGDSIATGVEPLLELLASRRYKTCQWLVAAFNRETDRGGRIRVMQMIAAHEYREHFKLLHGIAATEVGGAFSEGAVAGWFALGVDEVKWVLTDPCDDHVCELFAAMSPVRLLPNPLGVDLPVPYPPVHPGCGCHLEAV
jgi:hypothetical protein